MKSLIKAFLYLESKKLIRNLPQLIFGIFLFSIAFILVSYGIDTSIYADYSKFFIPGSLAFLIAVFSIYKGSNLIEERKTLLREIMLLEKNRWNIVISRMLSNSLNLLVISLTFSIVFIVYLGNLPNLAGLLFFILLSILFFQGIGISLSFGFDKTIATYLKTIFILFLYFFSEVFFRISGFGIFNYIKFINPLFYFGDISRGLFYGSSQVPLLVDFLVLGIMSLIVFALASLSLKKSQEYY